MAGCGCAKCNISLMAHALQHDRALTEFMAAVGAGAPKATGKTGVNVRRMWQLTMRSMYASGDLALIATREALQNSLDAIRMARSSKRSGQAGVFVVEVSRKERTITWEDNGIGMDQDTILNKFLVLGDTNKAEISSVDPWRDAVGGFGVAKAVILGMSNSFRWEMWTQNNWVIADGDADDIRIYDKATRTGTRITVKDCDWPNLWMYGGTPLPLRLQRMLSYNDLPIELHVVDLDADTRVKISPSFRGRRSTQIPVDSDPEDDFKFLVRAYKNLETDPTVVVRLNGLYQFAFRDDFTSDAVIDITTTLRPGERGYPLNAARDSFANSRARRLFNHVCMVMRRTDRRDDEVQAFLLPVPPLPHHQEAVKRMLPTLDALEPTLAAEVRRHWFSHSTAWDSVTLEFKRRYNHVTLALDAPASVVIKNGIFVQPDGQKHDIRHWKQILTDALQRGVDINAEIVRKVSNALQASFLWVADLEEITGEVEYAIFRLAALGEVRKVKSENPMLFLGVVRQHQGTDMTPLRRRSAHFVPLMCLWSYVVNLVHETAKIEQPIMTGFILDDGVLGLSGTHKDEVVVLVNPYKFSDVVGGLKEPLLVAAWVHAVAVHELTHANGLMGFGHNETFAVQREKLGMDTHHLLPKIATVATAMLKLVVPGDDPSVRVLELQAQLEACEGKAQRLKKIERELAEYQHYVSAFTRPVSAKVEQQEQEEQQPGVSGLEAKINAAYERLAQSLAQVPEADLREQAQSFLERMRPQIKTLIRQRLVQKDGGRGNA